MKKYYSTLRPVGPGTAPRGFIKSVNFDNREYIPEIGRYAWGYLIYEEPIDDPESWDMVEGENEDI